MIPASIQIVHAFENHEHTICTSLVENHFHQDNAGCDEFHKQLTIFSVEFSSNFDVIPTHFYSTTFIDKPQRIKEVYHSKKSSRGPPFFTI
ncbi:hypothetical protein CW731_04045 [Polaribacter sp. ALD11]|uniref:hypothetical protein n=1 Tax=Polaribacter sp. ALD11 TaxID=2058137 RepID=UPI000C3117B1|nr:hypothetical protein [Polaribacter sp. ALD11]AUC84521.1 hypothetical protein CW731_04045 [Polaribacter sp. ALD11]